MSALTHFAILISGNCIRCFDFEFNCSCLEGKDSTTSLFPYSVVSFSYLSFVKAHFILNYSLPDGLGLNFKHLGQ